ncbi:TetR family transcriptional regulator [Actinomadura hibisca]|uniref:TetR family transcriptional regulator n=1 Tax=Actinomadura hibisca TaxID=68565 RepID=UPI00247FC6BD|nr:TetR family transcriptional regulator [Actinomadura hibisca]
MAIHYAGTSGRGCWSRGAPAGGGRGCSWRQGVATTGVQDLVNATGLNRSSLYAMFGGKQELYRAALHAALQARPRARATGRRSRFRNRRRGVGSAGARGEPAFPRRSRRSPTAPHRLSRERSSGRRQLRHSTLAAAGRAVPERRAESRHQRLSSLGATSASVKPPPSASTPNTTSRHAAAHAEPALHARSGQPSGRVTASPTWQRALMIGRRQALEVTYQRAVCGDR